MEATQITRPATALDAGRAGNRHPGLRHRRRLPVQQAAVHQEHRRLRGLLLRGRRHQTRQRGAGFRHGRGPGLGPAPGGHQGADRIHRPQGRRPGRSHRGGDQNRNDPGRQDVGADPARGRAALGRHSAGTHHLALRSARRPGRSDHHHQRPGHHPTLRGPDHAGRHPQSHTGEPQARAAGRRPVLRHPQQPRRAAAQPAGQRQSRLGGAGPAQPADRRAGGQLQRAAGRAAGRTGFAGRVDEPPHRGVASDQRAGQRQPNPAQTRAGQAQRCARDPGQPQGGAAENAAQVQTVCDVVRRMPGLGAVFQGLRGQPGARPVRRTGVGRGHVRPFP